MSDIEKASADAVESAQQGEQFALMLAAIEAARQQPACTHQAPAPAAKPSGGAAKWIGIGIGGSFLAVALSISMVAFAIGATAATVCVLVLRSVWADFQRKG